MKNFKKTRTVLIMSAVCAAAMLTACGNHGSSSKSVNSNEKVMVFIPIL